MIAFIIIKGFALAHLVAFGTSRDAMVTTGVTLKILLKRLRKMVDYEPFEVAVEVEPASCKHRTGIDFKY